jgi:hypothetical protein
MKSPDSPLAPLHQALGIQIGRSALDDLDAQRPAEGGHRPGQLRIAASPLVDRVHDRSFGRSLVLRWSVGGQRTNGIAADAELTELRVTGGDSGVGGHGLEDLERRGAPISSRIRAAVLMPVGASRSGPGKRVRVEDVLDLGSNLFALLNHGFELSANRGSAVPAAVVPGTTTLSSSSAARIEVPSLSPDEVRARRR